MTCALVTGATGFVGSEVVRVLHSEAAEVHGLARAGADRAFPGGADVRWHVGDLLDPDSLRAAAGAVAGRAAELGVEPVAIHSAAVISYRTGDRRLQQRVNVAGTSAVLEACREAGFRRLVHVSSVVAVGPAAGAEDELDEDSAFDGDRLRCDYVDTKREAERLALAAAGDLEVVVVNPGAVFGPARSLSNTSHFLETLIERPWTGLVAPPGSMSCVGVSDVARGIVSALRAGRSGRRYLLTECNLRLDELYRRVLAACGRPPRVLRVPPPAWRAVVAASRVVDRIRPASLATPQSLGLLGAHFRFSSRRAHAELGWSPAPFDEVLARTLDWLGARRGGAEARCRPSPGEERP